MRSIVLLTTGLVLGMAGPAFAHGLGGRVDLPVPRWLFVFGAATALIVSFVALSALWTEPRFESRPIAEARPSLPQSVLTNPVLEWACRIVFLLLFVVVAMASARKATPTETIGPIVVYAWFWVGLTIAQAFLGDWWATISPFDTLGRLVGFEYEGESPPRIYPASWGRWPAAIFLFLFVWIELVDPFGWFAGSLGVFIVAYTLVQIAGMYAFGRRAWIENGEAFGVYLGMIARMSPLVRDRQGFVTLRPPLSGLAELRPRVGQVAVIMVALGSTTFDGISRTGIWVTSTARLGGVLRTVVFTMALLAVIGLVAGAYALAMMAASRFVEFEWRPLGVRFAHSLVPIVLAYVVAHYFSFLILEGQLALIRLSDPFAFGWDLFGTADWVVNLNLVSPTTIWYVQVASIVIGHVGGVILAHDRAIALFDRQAAIRTQYALLAVMVLFTASGLLILSG